MDVALPYPLADMNEVDKLSSMTADQLAARRCLPTRPKGPRFGSFGSTGCAQSDRSYTGTVDSRVTTGG